MPDDASESVATHSSRLQQIIIEYTAEGLGTWDEIWKKSATSIICVS